MIRPTFVALLTFTVRAVVAEPTTDNLRALISRADLHYAAPVTRSEDGLPVGNGRMGSLIWTTPTALRLQINRNDVQSVDSRTTSFAERNTDYMGGCGFVDVDLGGGSADIFTAENCPQQLSIFDGLATLQGVGVSARVLADSSDDVMAIEVTDRRAQPQPITVDLRMLRALSQPFNEL